MDAPPDVLHPVAVFRLRVMRRRLEEQLRALGRLPVPGESLVRTWQRVQEAIAENQRGAA